MVSLFLTSAVSLITMLSQSIQAANPQHLSLRTTSVAATPNITYATCYPGDTTAGQPSISRPDCSFVLQQFVQAHNATPNNELIITNNETRYADPSPENPYLQNGGVYFPAGEPVGPDNVKCQLVYSISYGAAFSMNAPDASITLEDFEMATNDLIVNCTGDATGGEFAVTSEEGQQIYVNVERAPY